MAKISAVLNTYNAEEHLEEVLQSLVNFDEIVVCDMESTDKTVDIAKRYGCRIVTFPRGEHRICEPARDFIIHSAANEWVFVVDADEIVPPTLVEYLYSISETPKCPDALLIPRSNLFLGQREYATDYQLRFMRKNKAEWPPIIHARPKISGSIGKVSSKHRDLYIIHLDDSNLTNRYYKMNLYTDFESSERLYRKYGFTNYLIRPLWFFIRSYFVKGGCFSGFRGLAKAYYSMTHQIMLMSKIMVAQQLNRSHK